MISELNRLVDTERNEKLIVLNQHEQLLGDYNSMKLSYESASELLENQEILFKLKLRERGLLLDELSNQINILRSEAQRKDNISSYKQSRVTPSLSVPLQSLSRRASSDAIAVKVFKNLCIQ